MYRRPLAYHRRPYNPQKRGPAKKPIRSFRDLEVYQRALEAAVMIATDICPAISGRRSAPVIGEVSSLNGMPDYPFLDDMLKLALEIPRYIAEAHTLRFDLPEKSLYMLEQARFLSNRMIVYLEQLRDIYAGRIERAAIELVIGRYANNRVKIFRLAKSWQRTNTIPPAGGL